MIRLLSMLSKMFLLYHILIVFTAKICYRINRMIYFILFIRVDRIHTVNTHGLYCVIFGILIMHTA